MALAIQAVAETHVPLGIIPTGTGNDIARAVGLPWRDPLLAVDAIVGGSTRTVDLGRISPLTG